MLMQTLSDSAKESDHDSRKDSLENMPVVWMRDVRPKALRKTKTAFGRFGYYLTDDERYRLRWLKRKVQGRIWKWKLKRRVRRWTTSRKSG